MIAAALLALSHAFSGGPLQDPVVLTIEGREVRRSSYAEWLLRARGELYAPGFVRLWRLRRKGAATGIHFDADLCRSLAEQEVARRIEGAFDHARERWLVELEREGRSPEGWLTQRVLGIEGEELLAALEQELGTSQRELLAEAGRPFVFHTECLRTTDPGATVLSIDDEAIPRAEYLRWLLAAFGELDARRMGEALHIEAVARAHSIEVTQEQADERSRSDLEVVIEHDYHGDRTAWLDELLLAGRTEGQVLREHAFRKRYDLMLEQLVLRERVVTEAALRRTWQERYGLDGKTIELRWIRLDTRSAGELDAARAEMSALRRRISEGEDFATLAERYSDDATTRLRGGRPEPGFSPEMLPAPLLETVRALEPGGLSAPLPHEGSVWLFEVTAVRETPFDEVRAQLLEELQARRPTEVELAAKRTELVREVDVRVLPAMFD